MRIRVYIVTTPYLGESVTSPCIKFSPPTINFVRMHDITITFPLVPPRAEGRVRHCRIQVDNNQYLIGSATFDSLTELVQYYESNPLYRRMKLKYAINDEVLKSIGEVRAVIYNISFQNVLPCFHHRE